LTDFGLCKVGLEEDEVTHSFCGSPEYMAPEVVTREGHGYAVDFYTLGALLHEMVCGLPPFYSRNQEEML
jgi:serine/threonine protein kinase